MLSNDGQQAAAQAIRAINLGRYVEVAESVDVADGERFLDSGSARAERVSGFPEPQNIYEDPLGFFVVTTRQLLYRDLRGQWSSTWAGTDDVDMRQGPTQPLGTSNLWVTVHPDRLCRFTANTPFANRAVFHFARQRFGSTKSIPRVLGLVDPPSGLPVADWYLDPLRPGNYRYWDGAAATEHRTDYR